MNRYIVSSIAEWCANDRDSLLIWATFGLLRRDFGQRTCLWQGKFLDLRRSDKIGMPSDETVFDAFEGSCLEVVTLLMEVQLDFYTIIEWDNDISRFCGECWDNASRGTPEIQEYVAQKIKEYKK